MDHINPGYPKECVMPLPKSLKSDPEQYNLRFKTPEKHQGSMVNISISFDNDKCACPHTEKRIEPLQMSRVSAKPPSQPVEIVRDYDRTEPKVYHAEYVRPIAVAKQTAYPELRTREVQRKPDHFRSKVMHGYLVTPREVPMTRTPVVHSEPPVRSQQSRYLLLKVDESGNEYDRDNQLIYSSVYQQNKHSPRMEVVPSERNHFFP